MTLDDKIHGIRLRVMQQAEQRGQTSGDEQLARHATTRPAPIFPSYSLANGCNQHSPCR